MIYLDSCALVKLIHIEAETVALEKYLDGQGEELVTCDLSLTEVTRVIRRVNHDSQRRLLTPQATLDREMAAADDLLSRIGKIAVDESIFVAAGACDIDPCLGSLDAIHLVAAQELGPAITSFITYDKTLGRAAVQAGLNLISPR